MNEIICPNCKKAFKVDETGFADILKQVRDQQFENELKNRLSLADKEKDSAVKLAEANVRNSLQEQLAKKDRELTELRTQNEISLSEKLNKKDAEITQLKAKIDNVEVEKKLAFLNDSFKNQLQVIDINLVDLIRQKDNEIEKISSQCKSLEKSINYIISSKSPQNTSPDPNDRYTNNSCKT